MKALCLSAMFGKYTFALWRLYTFIMHNINVQSSFNMTTHTFLSVHNSRRWTARDPQEETQETQEAQEEASPWRRRRSWLPPTPGEAPPPPTPPPHEHAHAQTTAPATATTQDQTGQPDAGDKEVDEANLNTRGFQTVGCRLAGSWEDRSGLSTLQHIGDVPILEMTILQT